VGGVGETGRSRVLLKIFQKALDIYIAILSVCVCLSICHVATYCIGKA